MKKKRLIRISILLAFAVTMAQVMVPGLTHATSDPASFIFDVSEGNITVSAGASAGTLKVTYGAGITTADFAETQQITIIGTTSNSANPSLDTAHKVVVNGASANITLSSVSVKNYYSGCCAFEIKNSANVELTLTGTNELVSADFRAGLEVEAGNTLTIKGTGTLSATGGYQGAAIGGGTGDAAGTIIISGGTVNAVSGSDAAGIGGGDGGSGGAVTIMAAAQVNASANGAGNKAIQTAYGSLEAASTARVMMANLKNTLEVHTLAEIRVKSNNNSGGWITTPYGCGSVAFTAPAETYQLFFAGFNLQQYPGGTDFVLPDTSGFTIFDDVEDAPMAPDLVDLVLSASNNYTFVGTTYTYNGVTVPNSVSSITVRPTGVAEIGAITVNGVTVSSGQASGAIALTAGVQKTITVIENQAGKTRKVYTIYITRANADQAAPTGLTGVAPSAYGASDGKITGTTTAMEYKLAASGTYTACSGTEVTGLAAGTYNVRYKAATGLNVGTPANVTIDNGPNADQAAPTGLAGVVPSAYGASDGKITGTTTAMEYKPVASGTYTACSGAEVTGLASGTYNVRYKAATGLNAGTPANVTIDNGPNADQAAPTGLAGVATSAYGASDGKITGTTTAMEYKLAASGTYTACSGTEVTGLAAGDYNVRYKAAAGLNAGTVATVAIADGSVLLTGTLNITGTVSFGSTLTANLNGTNNTGILSYQWIRGSVDIAGATSATYTLTEADLGQQIKVKIGSSVETETIISALTAAVTKADCATTTGITPVLLSKTRTSVVLMPIAGYEYIVVANGAGWLTGTWQSSNTFLGLNSGISYDFYQRVKETKTTKASNVSAKLDVTTRAVESEDTETPTPMMTPTTTPVVSPDPSVTPSQRVTPEPSLSVLPAASPQASAKQGIPIIVSIINQDEEKGTVTIEIDVDDLPNGTKAIELQNGEVFYLDGSDTVQIEVNEADLTQDGTIGIVAINDEEIAIGSFDVQIPDSDAQHVWTGGLSTALWVLGIILGVGVMILILYLILKKKRNEA